MPNPPLDGPEKKEKRGTVARAPVAVAIQRGINVLEPLNAEERMFVLKRLAARYRAELAAAAQG